MKFSVDYDLGMSGGGFVIDASSEHDAYKQFLGLLEQSGISIDDLDSFSLTPLQLPTL